MLRTSGCCLRSFFVGVIALVIARFGAMSSVRAQDQMESTLGRARMRLQQVQNACTGIAGWFCEDGGTQYVRETITRLEGDVTAYRSFKATEQGSADEIKKLNELYERVGTSYSGVETAYSSALAIRDANMQRAAIFGGVGLVLLVGIGLGLVLVLRKKRSPQPAQRPAQIAREP